MADFLDQKRQRFWQSVSADPIGFIKRVADRFFGVTLWYVPFDRTGEAKRPWLLWLTRLIYPLPFLGILILAYSAWRERLHVVQWAVIGVFVFYLLPYIGISYYDRYVLPLNSLLWSLRALSKCISSFGNRSSMYFFTSLSRTIESAS